MKLWVHRLDNSKLKISGQPRFEVFLGVAATAGHFLSQISDDVLLSGMNIAVTA